MLRVFSENITGEPLEHDYDIVEKDDASILKRSNNSNWADHVRGEKLLTYKDDGNHITITGNCKLKLDYCEAYELLIILLANNKNKTRIEKSKTVIEI